MQTTGQKCRLKCTDRHIVKMVGNISVRKECNMGGREVIKGSVKCTDARKEEKIKGAGVRNNLLGTTRFVDPSHLTKSLQLY